MFASIERVNGDFDVDLMWLLFMVLYVFIKDMMVMKKVEYTLNHVILIKYVI